MGTPVTVTAIASKATAAMLDALARQYALQTGATLQITSVGGVDAQQRVRAGEAFDIVMLARSAIDGLVAAGHLQAAPTDCFRSAMAVAVPATATPSTPEAGAVAPASEAALRALVESASRIGYSTGPSGDHLLQLLARWGCSAALQNRLVQAPPGIPVARLLADGAVDLGFQQFSELQGQSGVRVLGPLPDGAALVTVFSAALTAHGSHAGAATACLDFIRSPEAAVTIRLHGMEPA